MKTLPVILIGLMACLAIGISTARGQVGYSVEDLGVVKDMQTSEVVAINKWGHVAGTGYSGSDSCAFKYDYLKNSWRMPAASTAADSVSAPRTW